MKIAPKVRNLKEAMIRKGFSKTDLAKSVNIGSAYAIQICNGSRTPSPRLAKLIIETLETDFDTIFEITPYEASRQLMNEKHSQRDEIVSILNLKTCREGEPVDGKK